MKYVVSLYPNREVRVVRCPSVSLGRPEVPKAVCPQTLAEGIPEVVEAESGAERSEGPAPPSPLTLRPNSEPQARPGWGSLGRETVFGTNARRSLLRCGGVFDADGIPPEEVVFLTGTLPGGTMDAFVAIAAWSSAIVDRLKSWVSKHEKSTYSLYVWERQGRGALHLHYAVRLSCPVARSAILAGFRGWWYRQMCSVSDAACVDLFAWGNGRGSWRGRPDVIQADAQLCYRSISSYLAKYASKGAGKVGDRCDGEGVKMPWPVRWWGCSRPLTARCRELTKKEVFEGISWGQEKQKTEFIKGVYEDEFNDARELRKLREEGLTADSCEDLANIRYRYSDKAKTSEVFVGYGPASESVYNKIVKFFRPEKNDEPIVAGYDQKGCRLPGWSLSGGVWSYRHDHALDVQVDKSSDDGTLESSGRPVEMSRGAECKPEQMALLFPPVRTFFSVAVNGDINSYRGD